MKMSVREARAQFAAALDAAARGERVTITRNGAPIAELGPPRAASERGFDWARNARVRKELALDRPLEHPLDETWREAFDDPAWGRALFGLDEGEHPEHHAA